MYIYIYIYIHIHICLAAARQTKHCSVPPISAEMMFMSCAAAAVWRMLQSADCQWLCLRTVPWEAALASVAAAARMCLSCLRLHNCADAVSQVRSADCS